MKRPGVRRLFSMPLGRRDRWEREVEEEILTHLASRAERLVAAGMTPEDAKREAIRRFGALDEGRTRMMEAASHREDYMRRRETFGELRQDISFAVRTLSRNKGWATVAVLTLALGIGATTAVWSAASTLLLHPLKYPAANRVVNASMLPSTGNKTGIDVTVTPETRLIRAWRAGSRSFEAIEPYSSLLRALGTGPDAEDVTVSRVLPSFAEFAGERPLFGRNIMTADDRTGAAISEALWRTRFGSSRDVLGKVIVVGGESRQIVGVMPATLKMPRIGGPPTSVWLPLDMTDDKATYRVIARLRPGIPAELAARELDAINSRIGVHGAKQEPFRTVLTSPGSTVSFRDSLVMLAGAVLLVLFVAAGNVAHLLLARAITRQREVAIRTALGASRSRLVRQLMTETVLLTAIGCAFGALLGDVALKVLVKFRPARLPELDLAHVDATALAVVLTASVLCALGFGVVAAMASSARSSAGALRSGVVAAFSRGGERLRSGLVVTEIALSATLLVGAALLVRTVIEMQRSDLGFEPKNLSFIVPSLPKDRYPTPEARLAAVTDLAASLSTVAGVGAVTVSGAIPSYRNFDLGTLQVEGTPMPTDKSTSFIDVGQISSSYFPVLGARLVEGRMLDSSAANEIVINEAFARKQWKNGGAIGKRLRVVFANEDNPWMTVVGVVHDIATMGPVGDMTAPFLYMALKDPGTVGIVYRTNGDPATESGVLKLAKSRFPGARMHQQTTVKIIENTLAPPRFIMMMMAGFTILAVVLAAIGLYGMMAYAVAQRTREIGIRMALGASRHTIARSVVVRGAILGAAGAVIGLLLALWGTKVIEGSLYGVSRLDPTSYVVGGVLLVAIAIAASLIPMRRAVAVDPMTAIRAD